MASPPHTQEFEDAISVTPLSSHTYSANLSFEWAIGSVPHGGYTTAVLHRLATTHFQYTHPNRHHSDPMPISMQLTFLRRSAAGPALMAVQDMKLGLRTSTIHVTLSQEDSSSKQNLIKVVGYITISDPVSEVGLSVPCDWTVYPPPPSPQPPRFVAGDDEQPVPNSSWMKVNAQYSDFRRAGNHTQHFGPMDSKYKQRRGIIDQWSRLRSIGPKGGRGKWTNEAAAYLIDLFPLTLGSLDNSAASTTFSSLSADARAEEKQKPAPFWYPTVTLNIDFKKRLPPHGVEWLYSRVTTKAVRNGRTDIDVVLLDEAGEIVALGSQVALVVSASRNTSGRVPYKSPQLPSLENAGEQGSRGAKI